MNSQQMTFRTPKENTLWQKEDYVTDLFCYYWINMLNTCFTYSEKIFGLRFVWIRISFNVKDSKLQRLITSFEEIKIEEDESFDEFYAKFNDIVNPTLNLGETIPEPKIMRKVFRSLPERFHTKITAIEESKDIDKIPLTEPVGNLHTYKLGLTRIGKSSKSKSMALKA